MPRLSCWFVRAALLHLGSGVLIGGLLLSAKGFPAALGWAWSLLIAHIQLLIVGWLIQFALGVAYWILPRLDGAGERGRPGAAWFSFVALNTGTLLAALALSLRAVLPEPWPLVLGGGAALLQVNAVAAFGWHAWPRLRALPSPPLAARATQAAHISTNPLEP
jgi:heme/copper-type cytochrome/quinol oxidase subunit 1